MRARRAAASAMAAALAGLGLGACSADTAGLTPIAWQKVAGPGPGGALFGLGAAGSFDERTIFTVRAFSDGGVVWLYYGGADATGDQINCPGPVADSHWRVGLAQSIDGVNFTRVPGTVPGAGVSGSGVPAGTIVD